MNIGLFNKWLLLLYFFLWLIGPASFFWLCQFIKVTEPGIKVIKSSIKSNELQSSYDKIYSIHHKDTETMSATLSTLHFGLLHVGSRLPAPVYQHLPHINYQSRMCGFVSLTWSNSCISFLISCSGPNYK